MNTDWFNNQSDTRCTNQHLFYSTTFLEYKIKKYELNEKEKVSFGASQPEGIVGKIV